MTNQLDAKSQFQENIKFIKTPEEYDTLKYRTKFKFICNNCGVVCISRKYSTKQLQERQRALLCKKCSSEKTSLIRYGTLRPAQSNIIKDKMKQASLLKYGVEHPSQSETVKEKIKATFINKYGVACSLQNSLVKQKSEKTCLKKYGTINSSSDESVKQKRKETCKKRYGGDTPFSSMDVNEKRKNTMIKKYGSEHALQSEICKEKFKKTCNQKFGVDYPAKNKEIINKQKATNIIRYGSPCSLQNDDVQKKSIETIKQKYKNSNYNFNCKKIIFNDLLFDSFWELAFYVYHIDHNIPILRSPAPIEYIHNGESHLYYPDFEVGGQLYEIKGDQFFKKDGTMCNPYDHSQDALFEAKHQCALKNKVIFLSKNEIKPYLEYVEAKYGKDFKERCVVKDDQDTVK